MLICEHSGLCFFLWLMFLFSYKLIFSWMRIICKVCFLGSIFNLISDWLFFLSFPEFLWVCSVHIWFRGQSEIWENSLKISPLTHFFLRFPILFGIYGFLASLFWFSRLGRQWVFMHVSLSSLCETVWTEFSSRRKLCRLTYWYNCSLLS